LQILDFGMRIERIREIRRQTKELGSWNLEAWGRAHSVKTYAQGLRLEDSDLIQLYYNSRINLIL
jgi:hypothetical protein